MTNAAAGWLQHLVRVGIVTNVDRGRKRVRAKFPDLGFTSDWLFVLSSAGLPNVNARVLVLYLPTDNAHGFVLGTIE